MSRVILAKPISSPWSSRMASMTTWAQKRVPSLRTRQPSFSKRPFCLGDLQRLLRLAGFPIFLRVELREVPADDFVRAGSP